VRGESIGGPLFHAFSASFLKIVSWACSPGLNLFCASRLSTVPQRFGPRSDGPPDLNLDSPASCYRPIVPELKQILRPLPRLANYATVFRKARTRSQRCRRVWSETLADSSICLHRRNGRGHHRAGETSDI